MKNLLVPASSPPADGTKESWLRQVVRTALLIGGLTVFPALYLYATSQLTTARGPLWLGNNCDPSYVYLLNSALIVNGQPPFHTDHPGTMAQLVGAALLRSAHPQSQTTELSSAILEEPERYLNLIIFSVNAATAIVMFLCGALIFRFKNDLLPPLLFQAALFFFDQTYFNAVFFAPELFFPVFSLVLATVLYLGHERTGSTWFAAVAGAIAGASLMLKLTFLPFLPLGLAAFKGRRPPFVYIAFIAVAVLIIGFVIRHEFIRTWDWVVNLATHSGRYGSGPKEAIDWSAYFPTFVSLLRADRWYLPLLVSGVTFPLLSLVIHGWRKACLDKCNHLLLALTLLEFVAFAMVAKHAAAHYLMPLVALAPLHVLLVAKVLYSIVLSRWVRGGLAIALLGGGLWGGWESYGAHLRRLRTAAIGQAAGVEELAGYLRQDSSIEKKSVPVYYYRVSSKEFALYFGYGYARDFFADKLNELYPDVWFFNIFNARFYNYKELLTGEQFYARFPNPVFFGSDSISNMPLGLKFPLPQDAQLQLLWKNDFGSIHHLVYHKIER